MADAEPRTAVFLMNLGGPRSLEEVEPYLYELFSDPLVIDAPLGPLRRVLARVISRRRAPSSSEKYVLIGGRSPLVEGTQLQGAALAAALGPGFTAHLAMRYGHPNTAEAVCEALEAGAQRAVALPLYPQFANATTRSSVEELRRCWPKEKPLIEIRDFHDHPGFLDAMAECVRESLARVSAQGRQKLLVTFSAHGLPMSQVKKGDPYPGQVEKTAREVERRCGLGDAQCQVTYQSRVGPTKWLGPDTLDYLRHNAKGRAVVTVPVAFVSEHLETLYDLDILAAEAAKEGGALEYHRVATLNARPDFIAALAALVRAALGARREAA
jgi:protoporphyrin/coproporphyrin ferrochelatase